MSYLRRREALRERLRELEVDALLITELLNLRYLTGFTGSNGALLVHAEGDERSMFCTDGRYRTQSQQQVPDLRRIVERACQLRLAKEAIEAGIGRLGFESHVVTVDGHAALAKVTGADRLVAISRPVEALRLIKDDAEVAALRAACAAADTALASLLTDGGLRPGRTEREVARDLESRMVAAGAAGPSFETIVATGANSAIPHHRPTDSQLHHGDLLKLDFGALVDGYHSDMTRTVVLGQPAGWQRDLYNLVAAAQAAGRAALRAGAEVRDVDAAARDVIVHAGHGEEFVHGLGHGVGLQIHEAPALSQFGVGTLAAGMTVTVNELKNGLVLNLDGQLWSVVNFQHVKPGKGGAFVRTTLKNVLSGKVVDKTFNAGTKVETATVDRREMTYLYADGADFVFMDADTFDQITVPGDVVGDAAKYLLDNQTVLVAIHDGVPLYIELPTSVELVISHTDPGLQGDRSTGGTKPATLQTGAEIQVPLFVSTGEKVKVDTRDGRYLGRVSS
jgi:Xaa-Pro dipeptidase